MERRLEVMNDCSKPADSTKYTVQKAKKKYLSRKRCCLTSCHSTTKTASLYRFPKNLQLCESWRLNLNLPETFSKSSVVCSKHFKQADFIGYVNEGKRYLRLRPNAIPLLNIPGKTETNMPPLLTDEDMDTVNVESMEFLEIMSMNNDVIESVKDDLDFSKYLEEALEGPLTAEKPDENLVEKKTTYKKCCLDECQMNTLSTPPEMYHKFPSEKYVMNFWLKRLGIDKADVTEQTYLCSRHFTPIDYIGPGHKKRLKPVVAPSKNLPKGVTIEGCALDSHCTTNIYPSPPEHNSGISYHFFPLFTKKIDEWLLAIKKGFGVDFIKKKIINKRLCSRHFLDTEIRNSKNGKFLLDTAVPKRYVQNKIAEKTSFDETITPIKTSSEASSSQETKKVSPTPSSATIKFTKSKLSTRQESTPLGKAIQKTLFELKMQKLKTKRLEYQNSLLRLERAHGPASSIIRPAAKEVTRKLTVNDLDRIYCRLCLTTDVKTTTFSVFGVIDNEMISDLIKKYYGIEIGEFDAVTDVCESCLCKIDASKSISRQFGEADKMLKRILSDDEVELTEMVPLRGKCSNKRQFTKGTQTNSEFSETTSFMSDNPADDSDNMDISMDSDFSEDEEIEEPDFFRNYDSLVYCCTMCPLEFSTSNSLQHHMGSHQTDECIQCVTCGLLFKTIKHLDTHEKRVHLGNDSFFCEICDKTYATQQKLTAHLYKHRETLGGKKCLNCTEKFENRTELIRHIEQAHPDSVQHCDCGKSFYNPCTFARHACLIKNDWSENICEICQMKFLKHVKLIQHVEKEHSEAIATLPYTKCVRCSKTFLSQKQRFRHQVICNGYGGVMKE